MTIIQRGLIWVRQYCGEKWGKLRKSLKNGNVLIQKNDGHHLINLIFCYADWMLV